MPNPAFAKLKQTATIVFHAGEKAVRTATPVVRKAADDVRGRLRKPDPAAGPPPSSSPSAPPSSSPSSSPFPKDPDVPETRERPSPASIAKNVPHQRPVVKPPQPKKAKPSDSPGGKLPPRR